MAMRIAASKPSPTTATIASRSSRLGSQVNGLVDGIWMLTEGCDSVGALIRTGAPSWTPIFEGESPRARLTLLLQHFSELKDDREPWRVAYPLKEVLLLVTCATIASCAHFDDIVA